MKKNDKKSLLISFEDNIRNLYENKKIKGPVHLSGNNEDQLIKIFRKIKKNDWVFSNWRNHYHALLKGVNPKSLEKQIMDGKSMIANSIKNKFFCSSIVGGVLPIELGVALSFKLKKKKIKYGFFLVI